MNLPSFCSSRYLSPFLAPDFSFPIYPLMVCRCITISIFLDSDHASDSLELYIWEFCFFDSFITTLWANGKVDFSPCDIFPSSGESWLGANWRLLETRFFTRISAGFFDRVYIKDNLYIWINHSSVYLRNDKVKSLSSSYQNYYRTFH